MTQFSFIAKVYAFGGGGGIIVNGIVFFKNFYVKALTPQYFRM